MTENENTISKFYTAFANADTRTMLECYDAKIKFDDPAFGLLNGEDVGQMWQMLIEKGNGKIKIELSDIKADEHLGSVRWIASYNFSKTNRKVVNVIQAHFHFHEGLIIKHTDDFDVWKWSRQALGLSGFLFGWTGFMQKKIQEEALLSLKKYQKNKL